MNARHLLLGFALLLGLAPGAAAADLSGRTVVLDPGHNGGNWTHATKINRQVWAGNVWKACDTFGARTVNDYREAEHNWDVALRMRQILEAEGARVILTRSSNTGVGPCITRRAGIGNRARADAAISLHADGVNSNSATGFHVILPAPVARQTARMRAASRRLGTAIRDALRDGGPTAVSNYQGTDGLIARRDLGGLNLSKVPKVFVEIGNMRAPHDAAIIGSPEGRQQEAEAIVVGITRFLLSRRA